MSDLVKDVVAAVTAAEGKSLTVAALTEQLNVKPAKLYANVKKLEVEGVVYADQIFSIRAVADDATAVGDVVPADGVVDGVVDGAGEMAGQDDNIGEVAALGQTEGDGGTLVMGEGAGFGDLAPGQVEGLQEGTGLATAGEEGIGGAGPAIGDTTGEGTAESAAPETPAARVPRVDPNSKMQRAIAIFDRLHGEGKTRADILKVFQSDIGLSAAGSATYYQNIRKLRGLVGK